MCCQLCHDALYIKLSPHKAGSKLNFIEKSVCVHFLLFMAAGNHVIDGEEFYNWIYCPDVWYIYIKKKKKTLLSFKRANLGV